MRINTKLTGTQCEIVLADRMTFADHKLFRSMLEDIGKSGIKSCVLNVTDLTSVDSAGLGMFILAIEASKKGGWSVSLKGAQGQVKQLLMLAKFDKLLNMVD